MARTKSTAKRSSYGKAPTRPLAAMRAEPTFRYIFKEPGPKRRLGHIYRKRKLRIRAQKIVVRPTPTKRFLARLRHPEVHQDYIKTVRIRRLIQAKPTAFQLLQLRVKQIEDQRSTREQSGKQNDRR